MATATRPRSIPPRSVALAARADDPSWRGRTLLACSVLGVGVIGLGAINLDWSEGVAGALGQAAGMVAPLAGVALAVWGAAAVIRRQR